MDLMTDKIEIEIDRLDRARQVLRNESDALQETANRLDESFVRSVDLLWRSARRDGRVAITGVGKSADIAQKIVGTFNSTGTRAYLLDATRALHGDLGMVHREDVAIVISNSGESEEVVRLLRPLKEMAQSIIGLTANKSSTLAQNADETISYGPIVESSPFGLAPSTSAIIAMSIGHALAFALCDVREFTDDEFARYHPAGSLGFKLSTVTRHMRSGTELRIAKAGDSVRTVFAQAQHRGRRTGAVMLVDEAGKLTGLFTDSNLARLFERRADRSFDEPIDRVMTRSPIAIGSQERMLTAIDLMRARKISELPVIDELGCPVGLLDITDLLGAESLDELLEESSSVE